MPNLQPANATTARLANLYPTELHAATAHPFLTAAGLGTLGSGPLTRWLVQDKHYQLAYVRFVGRLVAKLDLSPIAFRRRTTAAAPSDNNPASEQQQQPPAWRALEALVGALNAIKAEIEFYDRTVEEYGLELKQEGPDEVTRAYASLFEESAAEERPLVCGLVVLWGTEYVYLRAWGHAKEQAKSVSHGDQTGAIAALHEEFIPNWTSDGFKASVDELANIVDMFDDGQESVRPDYENLWLRILELETRFWPDPDQSSYTQKLDVGIHLLNS